MSVTKYTVDEGVEAKGTVAKRVMEEEGKDYDNIFTKFKVHRQEELNREKATKDEVKEKNKRMKKRRACLEKQFVTKRV